MAKNTKNCKKCRHRFYCNTLDRARGMICSNYDEELAE